MIRQAHGISFHAVGRFVSGFYDRLAEVSAGLRVADIVVFGLIAGFGLMQFLCCERAHDFLNDDSFFADAAHSIVQHGFYGINGYAETNMPPGMSWIFAALSIAGISGHGTFLRTTAIFATVGFLASYELLRRQVPRGVAAAICLLLISSPIYFQTVSQWVVYRCPYFFFSIAALLVAREYDKAKNPVPRLVWGALLTALVAASLMLASVGIALLGGIVATLCIAFVRNRRLGVARLRRYFVVLLVAFVVQGAWVHHEQGDASAGISAQEWPIPGFPQSYLSQLKVKSGNYPELGMATPGDIALRIVKNSYQRSNLISRVLLRRPLLNHAWMSFLTLGVLMLVGLGWGYSVWPSGGDLQEWYFAVHELIYLLWPWTVDYQNILPIAPLTCFYLWRGTQLLAHLAKRRARALGFALLPVALFLSVACYMWMHGSGIAAGLSHDGLQDEASFLVWLMIAILALWMVWADTAWLRQAAALKAWCSKGIHLSLAAPPRVFRFLVLAFVSALIVIGLAAQIKIARANLDPQSATNRPTADVQAALWIRSNTAPNAVIMGREVPTVYHYSNRKVIWFPPSSNPDLLMEGVLKYKIDFVIVIRRKYSYYLPPDDDCFNALLTAYPHAFRLSYETPEFRIFKVLKGN
jgi:hypothetical protein